MEIILTKLANGALVPANEAEAEKIRKIKTGAGVRVTLTQMRNYDHHKKWFALAQYAFDVWADLQGPVEHKGQQIHPNFDRFRKDLIILAGYYTVVFNVRGEMRLEAKSISFGSMSQDEFDSLYSATIQAILTKILHGRIDEEQLNNYVNNVMSFD